MNIKQLASALRVSPTTIAVWVKNGCPAPKSPRGTYQFDLTAVKQWRRDTLAPRLQTKDTLTDARRRKENALAGLRELELRKRNGEVIERAAVEKAVFATHRAARDALYNLPSRCCGLLAAVSDQNEIFSILNNEVRQIMEELSGGTQAR